MLLQIDFGERLILAFENDWKSPTPLFQRPISTEPVSLFSLRTRRVSQGNQ